ncbi:MFS transporter [Methylosinus sp. Ce-a6]|uniref:MFS transporter n=1 Tax=Methylosinus sp. Ce-a6 TaxID=2172005 RepID=UPI00135ACC76|nr:MFS transporter [Methylosinus sp. Ce-a6]
MTKFKSRETAPNRCAELRLSLLQASIYAIVGVQLPFFAIWLSARGLDALEIAAVFAAQPVIRIVSMLAASRRADRIGDHGALLVGCMAAMAAAYAVMGWSAGFVPLLIAGAMVALAQGPLAPLADGVTFGEARRRREAGLPQLHYSWVRGWGSMSILVFLAASGPVAGALAVDNIVWLLACVAALACLACVGSLIGFGSSGPRAERDAGGRLSRPELVALVIAAAALVQSSHSMVNTFGALHWKEQGHSDTFVAFAWVAALATEVVAFLMAARWFGGEAKAGAFLVIGAIGAVLRWLLMSADPGPFGIFFAQALHGASCAAVQIGPAYLLAELGGKERLAQSQAWLAAAIAGGTSLLTFLAGPLYAQAGERGYLAMAAVAFVGLLLSCAVAQLCAPRRARAEAGRKAHAEPEHSSA